ncbi:hypothetical protein SAMN05216466_106213 [Paraburkholderia phenazinium]|uniref:Uncharacterized protein n=1 Tax=Paraburkholderia phenazinium TaxID=60549 RepID=A0A1G7YJ12_9BURK|nr:hypothetical protein [Paraburkholderia phenazinium]SDG96562.1 hypothetical protein SAMN05216466_106213 [Paraburkholderia phenazinium]
MTTMKPESPMAQAKPYALAALGFVILFVLAMAVGRHLRHGPAAPTPIVNNTSVGTTTGTPATTASPDGGAVEADAQAHPERYRYSRTECSERVLAYAIARSSKPAAPVDASAPTSGWQQYQATLRAAHDAAVKADQDLCNRSLTLTDHLAILWLRVNTWALLLLMPHGG